jgi:polar amino acid transport system substrate-binding protein
MKSRFVPGALLALLVSVFPALSSAESPVLDRVLKDGVLRVATSGTQPPFNAVSKEGELIGFEVDLARLLADAMGVDLSLTSMPFPDLLPALREGKSDMVLSGLSITPERSQEFAFVGPYLLSGKSVLTDSRTLAGMKTPRDLDRPELTLVALENSTSQSYLARVAPRAKRVTTRDYDTAVEMVISKTATALVADMPVCILAVMRHPRRTWVRSRVRSPSSRWESPFPLRTRGSRTSSRTTSRPSSGGVFSSSSASAGSKGGTGCRRSPEALCGLR